MKACGSLVEALLQTAASFGSKWNSVWMCHLAAVEYDHFSHFLQEMALRGMAIRGRLRGVGYQEHFFQRANQSPP